MTQKQIIGVVVGVVLMLLLGVFVYTRFSDQPRPSRMNQTKEDATARVNVKDEEKIPESIDAITESIFIESSVDTSAMSAETEGETAEIDEDNESVNNLETSYDENNL